MSKSNKNTYSSKEARSERTRRNYRGLRSIVGSGERDRDECKASSFNYYY